jgi:hypothetical protein
METPDIKNLTFELAYLTLLTKTGLKPLSRWEAVLKDEDRQLIESLGLSTAYVNRKLTNGSKKTEFVFSRSGRTIDLYLARFEDTFIDKSVENIRRSCFTGAVRIVR